AVTAGVETTLGATRAFLLAMLLHPEIQKRAQEELDCVVGNDRLPMMEDRPNLPYLDAVIKETLRWRPVSPISVPTAVAMDDVYEDINIHKGTIVIQNNWAISRDPTTYGKPETFCPERWLTPNPPTDSRLWAFGIGRRICPGIAYAETLYTTLFMTILATVDIVRATGPDGMDIHVSEKAPTNGRVACVPTPFSYRLLPRSADVRSLLCEGSAA
ncbi:cytochrome P450, partial [Clavulina sp. PMI_390]